MGFSRVRPCYDRAMENSHFRPAAAALAPSVAGAAPEILPPAAAGLGFPLPDPLACDPLAAEARAYAQAARAASTLRAYRSDWRHFCRWCEGRGADALPTTPGTVALYLAALARTHRPGTITRRLTAITRAHAAAGHPTPASMAHPQVRETLQGIRRTLGVRQQGKTALRTSVLGAVLAALPPGLAGVRDRAVILLGFAGAARRANLAAIEVENLLWSDEGIAVTLPRSKTDPEGRGHTLAVPRGAHPDSCPVRALEAWLGAAGITAGPVFRAVDRHGRVGAKALHPESVAAILKRAVARAGFDPAGYGGHSLRAGFATEAARGGATVWDIMRQTGHRSPLTVARYIRDAGLFQDAPARRLGL